MKSIFFHRDVFNRSFLKIHEKNRPQTNPVNKQDDIHSLSESECNDLERYHIKSNNSQSNYAESLQDADLQSPRMRRTNSGSSIKSDNVFSRSSNAHVQSSATSSFSSVSQNGARKEHENGLVNSSPRKLTKER